MTPEVLKTLIGARKRIHELTQDRCCASDTHVLSVLDQVIVCAGAASQPQVPAEPVVILAGPQPRARRACRGRGNPELERLRKQVEQDGKIIAGLQQRLEEVKKGKG